MRYLTLALDVMGGDFGPCVTIPAALQALRLNPRLVLLLVGKPSLIEPLLIDSDRESYSRIQIIPAQQADVSNSQSVSQAVRNSQETSMYMALELVKSGLAEACVSAGDTRLLMGLATSIIKTIEGIRRPALMTVLHNRKKSKTVVLDLGANTNCSGTMLVTFAVMGSALMEQVFGISRPRVSLLNIGREKTKGLNSIRDASLILENMPLINYTGYIEADDLLTGKTDVVVCDGFSGNIMLKAIEGITNIFFSILKSQVKGKEELIWTPFTQFSSNAYMAKLSNHLNLNHNNGACLLGLRKTVIKSHGRANRKAFVIAIEQAVKEIQLEIPEKIASCMDSIKTSSFRLGKNCGI